MDNRTIGKLFLSGFAFLAAAGGVWTWGYYAGVVRHEGEVNLLRTQNEEFKKDLLLLREENKSLSIKLLSDVSFNKTALPETINEARAKGTANTEQVGITKDTPQVDDISLNVGSHGALLNGKLLITLSGVEFVSNPFRHVVTANIGTRGKENLHIDAVDPGYRVVYEGYEVRVLSSSTGHARFSAVKLQW